MDSFYENFWKQDISRWSPHDKTISKLETKLFHENFPHGGHVLDYGCGDGSHSGKFLDENGYRYTGIDVSEAALALCREKSLDAIQFSEGFAIPLDEMAVDGVVCFEVLEHVFSPDSALGEIQRVLRPGAALVGSVPNFTFIGNRLLMLMGIFNPGGSPLTSLRKPWADPHIRFFTYDTIRLLLDETGFKNIRTVGASFSFLYLPKLYKATGIARMMFRIASAPLSFLGRIMPSVFSPRIYFVATKPI